MAYVQSASATSAKKCQIIKKVGLRTILKNKFFCRDGFQQKKLPETKTQIRYFYRDQKHILAY